MIYDIARARLYAYMCMFRIGYYTSFPWFYGSFRLLNRGKIEENGGFSAFSRVIGCFLPHFRWAKMTCLPSVNCKNAYFGGQKRAKWRNFEKSCKIIWKAHENPLSLHPQNERNTVLTNTSKSIAQRSLKDWNLDIQVVQSLTERSVKTKVEQCEAKVISNL